MLVLELGLGLELELGLGLDPRLGDHQTHKDGQRSHAVSVKGEICRYFVATLCPLLHESLTGMLQVNS